MRQSSWLMILMMALVASCLACGVEDEGSSGSGEGENNGGGNNAGNNAGNNIGNNGGNNAGNNAGNNTTPLDAGGQDLDPQDDFGQDIQEVDFGLPPEDLGGVDAGFEDLGGSDVGADLPVEEDLGPEDVGSPDVGEDTGGPDAMEDMGAPDVAEDMGSPDVVEDVEVDMGGGLCPPQGPYGSNVGDTIPNVELRDCDGTPYYLHDLCMHRVSWVFEFAAWCPPCQTFARQSVNRIYSRFHDAHGDDFGAFVVISQNSQFGTPTQRDCQSIKTQYNLAGITVLYDYSGSFPSTLGVPSNDINILMREGGEIFFRRQYSSGQVEGALEAEFAR